MKYYGTKNNLNYGFYSEPFEGAIELSEETWKILQVEQSLGKKIVSDNKVVFSTDESDKFYINDDGKWTQRTNDEFNTLIEERNKEQVIKTIKKQIEDLDIKRIRAICEPSIKDEITGETWLDFYNTQIIELRNKLTTLTGTTYEE